MNNVSKKKVTNASLFSCDTVYIRPLIESVEYPWEILSLIPSYISSLIACGIEGYTEYRPGILIGTNVTIAPTATIGTNVIIGSDTTIGPGAYIRQDVLTGPGCNVGNSTELKNCVLMEHVQVPHYNYVGDSVLGAYAHLGAGAVCSNLKSDKKNIVIHGDEEHTTGLRKIGGFLGDHTEIGCHCVINPGTIIGQNTSVYPLTAVRGVIPGGLIVKSMNNMIKREDI